VGFDWERAKQIFYNLTDIQKMWLNAVSRLVQREEERELKKARDYRFGARL